LKQFIARHFPERQLYFRANGEVRFISLKTNTQLVITFVAALSVMWISVSSYNLLIKDKRLLQKDDQILDSAQRYKALEAQLHRLEQTLEKKATTIQNRQNYIQQILAVDQKLDSDIPEENLNIGETDSQNAIGDQSSLDGRGIFSKFTSFFKTKTQIVKPYEFHNKNFASLNIRFTDLETDQLKLSQHLNNQILTRIENAEKIFKKTGMKKNEFLKVISASPLYKQAQGGPLIATNIENDDVPHGSFTTLNKNFYKMFQLEHAISTLPVIRPLHAKHYISSGFGVRIDPIKKTWTRHHGVDIPGWWKTPIHATAAGKVIRAGNNGSYGRFIEIDHGNGFKTRYGHLLKILVKRGEIVSLDQKIGLMGSSGRSTGTHLHYEIRFKNKPINPYKFFKAKKDVFEIQQRKTRS
jgi:murein DD-endopeptidase MepM/ murein hydrolase activator NlpD